jgi:hypothetical protein
MKSHLIITCNYVKKIFPTWKDNITIYFKLLNCPTLSNRSKVIYSASMQFLNLLTNCSSKNVVHNLSRGISPILKLHHLPHVLMRNFKEINTHTQAAFYAL